MHLYKNAELLTALFTPTMTDGYANKVTIAHLCVTFSHFLSNDLEKLLQIKCTAFLLNPLHIT